MGSLTSRVTIAATLHSIKAVMCWKRALELLTKDKISTENKTAECHKTLILLSFLGRVAKPSR